VSDNLWPPVELEGDLAQVGRTIIHFNSLEKHTSGVLRQFIIDDFSDRVVLGLCESLNGVELEKNLRRFAYALEHEHGATGCEDVIRHLIKVYQNGKSLRNRIVHELANSLHGQKMHLHKHTFSPNHAGKGLLLERALLDAIVKWLSDASRYSAEVGIELSFVRGLRDEKQRQFIPDNEAGWPAPISLLTWDNIAAGEY